AIRLSQINRQEAIPFGEFPRVAGKRKRGYNSENRYTCITIRTDSGQSVKETAHVQEIVFPGANIKEHRRRFRLASSGSTYEWIQPAVREGGKRVIAESDDRSFKSRKSGTCPTYHSLLAKLIGDHAGDMCVDNLSRARCLRKLVAFR
ncbi:MAG: hypothetical protein WCI74_17130, partial [Actinomycetes bacterium]